MLGEQFILKVIFGQVSELFSGKILLRFLRKNVLRGGSQGTMAMCRHHLCRYVLGNNVFWAKFYEVVGGVDKNRTFSNGKCGQISSAARDKDLCETKNQWSMKEVDDRKECINSPLSFLLPSRIRKVGLNSRLFYPLCAWNLVSVD